jgi:hypothetical protein
MNERLNKRRHPLLRSGTVNTLLRHETSESLLRKEQTYNNSRTYYSTNVNGSPSYVQRVLLKFISTFLHTHSASFNLI